MPTPLFSILIPSIIERLPLLIKLTAEIQHQFEAVHRTDVEIISVVDNRIVTIGEKRQLVLDASHGRYAAFVDDDDWIMPNYVAAITQALDEHPDVDVVTFNQMCTINGQSPEAVYMNLKQPNQDFKPGGCLRGAWHICVWRSALAKQFKFPAINYGEDWAWAEQCGKAAQTEQHLDLFLHQYRYNQKTSRAP